MIQLIFLHRITECYSIGTPKGPPPTLYSAVELADVPHELANFMAEDGEMPRLQVMGPLATGAMRGFVSNPIPLEKTIQGREMGRKMGQKRDLGDGREMGQGQEMGQGPGRRDDE